MKFLFDTHVAIWTLFDDHRLSQTARGILNDPSNEFLFSVCNIWEISIKRGLHGHGFQHDPREIRQYLLRNGCEELTIQSRHIVEVDNLPPIHKDPFDRILIAQAIVEGITLLTADAVIAQYPGPIRKV
ncbi:MAG: type II toxin-antitoxin system VapC family toxin [Terracidiphilus sp.]|jgi:PIN domain nuclease of toxin-antitoxin system